MRKRFAAFQERVAGLKPIAGAFAYFCAMAYSNIILDLGGVLLNLDFKKTEAAFARLGLPFFDQYFTQFKASPLFEELEIGAISKEDFLSAFRKETGVVAEDSAIIAAWNSMLLDFPSERIRWLHALSEKYRVFLFSNTNAFHHEAFQQSFSAAFPSRPFDDYFEKAYYSHILGKRKPLPISYMYLLEDAGIVAEDTLFIDDTLGNIEGARKAGLQAVHLTGGKSVLDLDL